MEEEKYIQTLFESARKEDPQLSFEEVSRNLETSLNPGVAIVLKDWLLKHIYLNTILVLLAILILSVTVFSGFESKDKQNMLFTEKQDNPHPNEKDISTLGIQEEPPIQIIENTTMPQKEKTIIKETHIKNTPLSKPRLEVSNVKREAHANLPNLDTKSEMIKTTDFIIEKTPEPPIVKSIKAKKQSESKKQDVKLESKKGVRTELETILETALNTADLKNEVFARNAKNEFNQLILVTNGVFDDLIKVDFAGKKVILIKSIHSGSFVVVNDEFVNVQDFKIDGETAILAFKYNSTKVQVELEKIDDIWVCKNTLKNDQQHDQLIKKELLQMAFDDPQMIDIIGKGEFKPFSILANDQLSNKIALHFKGTHLNIVPNLSSRDYSKRVTYMKILNLQIKRKKAVFVFSYLGKTTEINYRKKDENWTIHSYKQTQ